MSQLRNFLCVASAALLAACGSEPDPAATAPVAAASPAVKAQAAPAATDATAKMARAVGAGKPGAAVDIKYEFLARPEAGKPMELAVALIPSAGVDSMEATFSGMEGITLAGNLTASFGAVKAGEPYKHVLSVLPNSNGVFYVTVSVNTQIGGATLGKTFSIPFVVGNQPVQQKAKVPEKDSTGQAIEPMKAEETTSR